MISFLDKLLKYYNISLEDFKNLNKETNIDDLITINNFKNGVESSFFVKECIKKNKKILVFGDYDADGMLATSILVYTFKKLNFNNYGFYIPSRYKDGYGLNVDEVKIFKEKNYEVIICVDNGISQFEAIKYAKENNIDVVICDHHEITNKNILPDTKYIIHPQFSSLKQICSGAFTSLVLANSLIEQVDEYLIALATISTFTDMMFLKDNNFNFVRYGLKIINKNNFLQLNLLSENKFIDETIISSLVGPKINSVGRLSENYESCNVVRFFVSNNNDEILKYYQFINNLNIERKNLSNSFDLNSLNKNDFVIVDIVNQKEGMLGLLCNRALFKYKLPTILFTYDFNDHKYLKGSARVSGGYSLIDFFKNSNELLVKFGGHESAGGLTIETSKFNEFRDFCFEYFKNNKNNYEKKIEYIDINLTDLTLENYYQLLQFGPFGIGREMPIFKFSGFPIKSFSFSKDNKHIITPISLKSKIVWWNFKPNVLENKKSIDLYGKFTLNVFNNKENLNFNIINDD